MNATALTAAQAGLAGCHACGLLQDLRKNAQHAAGHTRCPRCGAPVHQRKPNSLSRTWALVVAAFILYIPANIYPVMTVEMFGRPDAETIPEWGQSTVRKRHVSNRHCGVFRQHYGPDVKAGGTRVPADLCPAQMALVST